MRENIAIYPFYPRLLPYIRRYNQLQDKYQISEVYVPQGLGLNNVDLSYACNHESIGIKGKLINNLGESKTNVLVLIDDLGDDFKNSDFPDITKEALLKEMDVKYYSKSIDSVSAEMWSLSEEYSERVEIIIERHKYGGLSETRLPLQTPVILVGGLIDEPDVLEVLLQVYLNLTERGFKASVFTKTPFILGTNFHSISALFDANTDEKENISALKDMLKEIEHIEQPDIILMETPDPIMEYNEFTHNGYGIRTYMISLAVIPDSMICVIPNELCVDEYIEMVSKFVNEKYNTLLDGVHGSNSVIDSLEVFQTRELSWIHVPLDEVSRRIESNQNTSKIPIINTLNDGTNIITSKIINRLSY